MILFSIFSDFNDTRSLKYLRNIRDIAIIRYILGLAEPQVIKCAQKRQNVLIIQWFSTCFQHVNSPGLSRSAWPAWPRVFILAYMHAFFCRHRNIFKFSNFLKLKNYLVPPVKKVLNILFRTSTIILQRNHSPVPNFFRYSSFKIGQSQPCVPYKSVAWERKSV